MIQKSVQQRYFLETDKVERSTLIGREFAYGRDKYTVLDYAPSNDLLSQNPPIGVQLTGSQAQYTAQRKRDKKQVELMFYWYTQTEGKVAVILDGIKEVG